MPPRTGGAARRLRLAVLPSGPPSAPPSGPLSGPPSGPPSGLPSRSPSGSPSGPPSRARRLPSGSRRRLVALALLAAPACSHPAERVSFVTRARERDAVVAAALVVLFAVAGRLGSYAGSDDRARRWPLRPERLPALLVASAVASQVTALLLLGLVGAYVGYFLPEPGRDGGVIRLLAVVVTAGPVGVVAAVGAGALLVVARRVPQVGTGAFAAAAGVHAFAAVLGVVVASASAGYDRPGAWVAAGWLLALVSSVGVVGYAYGLRLRGRVKRAARR